MMKPFSLAVSTAFGFLVPTLGGVLFFFTIIGVFGLWLAIGGLLLAVTLALTIFRCIPVEGDRR